ncbi:MAG: hypothetical protein ACN4EJ_06500 [Porticoccaceae bacterium]
MNSGNRYHSQGAVLAVTLILLLLLALTVTAAVRSHSVQTLLLANQQRSLELQSLVERTVESVISNPGHFLICQQADISCGEMDAQAETMDAALQCHIRYVGKQSGLGCSINMDSTAPCHASYLWDVQVAVLDRRRDSSNDFSRAGIAARQGISFFHRSGLPGCEG